MRPSITSSLELRLFALGLLAIGVAACDGETPADAGAPDAAAADAGRNDAGAVDGGSVDAGSVDAGSVDSGTGDAGPLPTPVIGPRAVEPTPLSEGTMFVSPDGDGELCTEAAPCSLQYATQQAGGDDVVFMRGGVYAIVSNLSFRGRGPGAPVFESYGDENAILEGTGSADDEYYVRVLGDPVVLRRFEVRNMPRAALNVRSSGHLLEGLHVHHNLLSGIHIHESYETPLSNDNVIRDCIVHDNSGVGLTTPTFADGGNSDGISISSGLRNRVEHCLVYNNSDDGVDTWRSQDGYVGFTRTYGNGLGSGNGQGFKAGGAPPSRGTTVEHCIAHDNLAAGFDQNSGLMVRFERNTAWRNSRGYYSGADTLVANCISAEDETAFGGAGTETDNSWQRSGELTFVSTEPDSVDFLRPTADSGFADLGAYSGL
ncbi:MAG: right-handed parallel beta-helix repeat-containing protein [Sandaracinaceae bacterium]